MSYSTSPTLDAIRSYESQADETALLAQAEDQVRSEIASALTLRIRTQPASSIAVPCVDFHRNREGAVTALEVARDMLTEGRVDQALCAVLQLSSCPHVAKLREAIAKAWSDAVASDVAEYRV